MTDAAAAVDVRDDEQPGTTGQRIVRTQALLRFGGRDKTGGARRSHPRRVATRMRAAAGIAIGCSLVLTASACVSPSDQRDAGATSVARTTRVCTYDRSDIRFSGEVTTPRPQPHKVDLDVSDLHSLLAAIGERGPYVFVSHSYGGLISTLYARTYPKSIAGLVMVDTVSEVMQDLVTPGALDWWDQVNAATSDVVREGVMIKDAFAQINAAGPMPKVPAVVLVADKPFHDIPPETLQGEHTTFADWLAMVNKLGVNLGAKTITKTNSGHNIYL